MSKNCNGSNVNERSQKSNKQSRFKSLVLRIIEGSESYIKYKLANFPSKIFRNFIYRHIFLMKIGKNVIIYRGFNFMGGYGIEIGDKSVIGNDCFFDGRSGLKIGSNVNFSSHVSVYTGEHLINDPFFSYKGLPVLIEDYAWISCETVILPGVNVGRGSVLAAGAVATKDLISFSIYAGIPAIKKGERNKDLLYELGGKARWFY